MCEKVLGKNFNFRWNFSVHRLGLRILPGFSNRVLCARLRKSQDLGKTQGLVEELVEDEPHLWAQNLDRCRSRWIGANEISRSFVPQKPRGIKWREVSNMWREVVRTWSTDYTQQGGCKEDVYQPSTSINHIFPWLLQAQKRQWHQCGNKKNIKNMWQHPCPKMGNYLRFHVWMGIQGQPINPRWSPHSCKDLIAPIWDGLSKFNAPMSSVIWCFGYMEVRTVNQVATLGPVNGVMGPYIWNTLYIIYMYIYEYESEYVGKWNEKNPTYRAKKH